MPGLLGALGYNASRRQPDVRLFEVGVVFSHPGRGAPRVVERSGADGTERAELPGERELLPAVFAGDDDDARAAVASWHVLADALRLDGCGWCRQATACRPSRACTRRAPPISWPVPAAGTRSRSAPSGRSTPRWRRRFDLTRTSGGGTSARRVGWLEVDLGLLLDETRVPRRITVGGAVSRFPSSDIDLAFVVEDRYPADAVADALGTAGGDLLESVHLFDVYRGPGIDEGARSLAYRLRFCAARPHADRRRGRGAARPLHRAVAEEFGAILR